MVIYHLLLLVLSTIAPGFLPYMCRCMMLTWSHHCGPFKYVMLQGLLVGSANPKNVPGLHLFEYRLLNRQKYALLIALVEPEKNLNSIRPNIEK